MPIRTAVTALLLLFSLPLAAGPVIQHWETDNGARVYFVEAHELPMMDLQITFDAAASRDGNRPGLALLTSGMLEEGADGLDADEIAEGFDRLGARFGLNSLKDMALVKLRSLTESSKLKPALELMRRIITKPEFPPDALERVRKQVLVNLRMVGQSPGRQAGRAYYRALYGDHPYAHPANGDIDSITSLKREELQAFHNRYYVARNAVISIVGDLTRSEAEKIAQELVSGLPEGERPPPIPQVASLSGAVEKRISHPSTQTHLLIGQPGISRKNPDLFPLYVGNHIFGGSGLVSILSNEVREKRGLSYSVSSGFHLMRERGPFTINLQTRNSQADEALKVVRDTLAKFIEEGPTEERLKAAKQNITGGFPLSLDSNGKISGFLAMIGFYGLPLDYLDTFTQKVEAVTLEQVRDAFRRRVDPNRMLTVVVGGAVEEQTAKTDPESGE